VDADGDGVDECSDCDDDDADNYPGNTEICDGQDNDCDGAVDEGCEPCVGLIKTISGPYRTSDDEFLDDGIIPVAVVHEPCWYRPDNPENLFYFLVEITVRNCGGIDLTNVVVQDTFSNEAQPFETGDPGNVTITPSPSIPGFDHESLTWSVGTIPAGQSRTLRVKVGTEFNSARNPKLEPTSAPQTIFYNGQDDNTGSASVTAEGGLSASVGAMAIRNGSGTSCVGSEGEWDDLWRTCTRHHDRDNDCAQITTSLPITLTASDPPGVISTTSLALEALTVVDEIGDIVGIQVRPGLILTR
jgi:hypothetical protein